MGLDEKYNTGVVWQDFQHKELMDLFMKMQKARQNKTDQNAFKFAIAFLSMYVNHHFKLEEEYMDIYYYPGRDAHKKEHQTFVKTLKAFRSAHTGYSDDAMDELMQQIRHWILDHILGDDRKLGQHILNAEKK